MKINWIAMFVILSLVVSIMIGIPGCEPEDQDKASGQTPTTTPPVTTPQTPPVTPPSTPLVTPPPTSQPSTLDWGNTTCPVMGGSVDKNIFTMYEGKKVYFCCPGCIKSFQENPEKYADALKISSSAQK